MKTDVYATEGDTISLKRPRGKQSAKVDSGDPAEMAKLMEEAGRPGPAHDALKALAGEWQAEVMCWMDPKGAPEVTRGTASTKWILSGHFLEEEFHGEMGGKAYTGRLLLGYDNTKQKFNSIWMSDTQTSMFMSEGSSDGELKVITLQGKATCPTTKTKDVMMKTVVRILSPDQHVLEMYDGSKGNGKTLEVTYTRV